MLTLLHFVRQLLLQRFLSSAGPAVIRPVRLISQKSDQPQLVQSSGRPVPSTFFFSFLTFDYFWRLSALRIHMLQLLLRCLWYHKKQLPSHYTMIQYFLFTGGKLRIFWILKGVKAATHQLCIFNLHNWELDGKMFQKQNFFEDLSCNKVTVAKMGMFVFEGFFFRAQSKLVQLNQLENEKLWCHFKGSLGQVWK